MADQFLVATNDALEIARLQLLFAAEARNQEVVLANRPSSVARTIDNVVAATDVAFKLYKVAVLSRDTYQAVQASRITYRYSYMDDVVQFALATLRERSPVGDAGDDHPGLYRDSHIVFIDGHVVSDARDWHPGQQVNISSPVPYARKIEVGGMQLSVPAHVYEDTAHIVAARFGNSHIIRFVYMPVRFGDVAAYAAFSKQLRPGRRMNERSRQEWLVRQPALQITAR